MSRDYYRHFWCHFIIKRGPNSSDRICSPSLTGRSLHESTSGISSSKTSNIKVLTTMPSRESCNARVNLLATLSLCLLVVVTGVAVTGTEHEGRGKNPLPLPRGNVPGLSGSTQAPGSVSGGAGTQPIDETSESESAPAAREDEAKGLSGIDDITKIPPKILKLVQSLDTFPETYGENSQPAAGNGGSSAAPAE
ncbi:uncharacterized protein LOC144146885 [Haemaphysalis longicornis]